MIDVQLERKKLIAKIDEEWRDMEVTPEASIRYAESEDVKNLYFGKCGEAIVMHPPYRDLHAVCELLQKSDKRISVGNMHELIKWTHDIWMNLQDPFCEGVNTDKND